MPPFFKGRDQSTMMADHPQKTVRKPRADAIRNRERVLEAAKAVFSAGGPDASLEAVAKTRRRRHRDALSPFPDPRSPVRGGLSPRGAAARRSGGTVEERGRAGRSPAPLAAIQCRFVATKKGMSAALALAVHGSSELYAYSFDRLTKAVGALARSRRGGRRDPRRYQPGGPSARPRRHVLHARPARLAGERRCGCSTSSWMAFACKADRRKNSAGAAPRRSAGARQGKASARIARRRPIIVRQRCREPSSRRRQMAVKPLQFRFTGRFVG